MAYFFHFYSFKCVFSYKVRHDIWGVLVTILTFYLFFTVRK